MKLSEALNIIEQNDDIETVMGQIYNVRHAALHAVGKKLVEKFGDLGVLACVYLQARAEYYHAQELEINYMRQNNGETSDKLIQKTEVKRAEYQYRMNNLIDAIAWDKQMRSLKNGVDS
jgi:hypothetical protein